MVGKHQRSAVGSHGKKRPSTTRLRRVAGLLKQIVRAVSSAGPRPRQTKRPTTTLPPPRATRKHVRCGEHHDSAKSRRRATQWRASLRASVRHAEAIGREASDAPHLAVPVPPDGSLAVRPAERNAALRCSAAGGFAEQPRRLTRSPPTPSRARPHPASGEVGPRAGVIKTYPQRSGRSGRTAPTWTR
jgi:hypothetical protein